MWWVELIDISLFRKRYQLGTMPDREGGKWAGHLWRRVEVSLLRWALEELSLLAVRGK